MSVWIAPEPHDSLLPSTGELRDTLGRAGARLAYRLRLPLALSGGLFAALAVLQLLSPTTPPAPAAEPETDVAAGVWTRQSDTSSQLALTAPAFAGLTRTTGVWTRTRLGQHETEDRLSLGDIDRAEPFVLAIAERRPASDIPVSLFLASARHAADAGLAIGRFTPVADSADAKGMVELGRISLARAVGFGPVRNNCLAWRTGSAGRTGSAWRTGHDGPTRLEGIACLPQERPDETMIACLLHDLALGSDAMGPSTRLGLLEAAGTVACEPLGPAAARTTPTRVARRRQ